MTVLRIRIRCQISVLAVRLLLEVSLLVTSTKRAVRDYTDYLHITPPYARWQLYVLYARIRRAIRPTLILDCTVVP